MKKEYFSPEMEEVQVDVPPTLQTLEQSTCLEDTGVCDGISCSEVEGD